MKSGLELSYNYISWQPQDPRAERQPRDPRAGRQPRDPQEGRQPQDPHSSWPHSTWYPGKGRKPATQETPLEGSDTGTAPLPWPPRASPTRVPHNAQGSTLHQAVLVNLQATSQGRMLWPGLSGRQTPGLAGAGCQDSATKVNFLLQLPSSHTSKISALLQLELRKGTPGCAGIEGPWRATSALPSLTQQGGQPQPYTHTRREVGHTDICFCADEGGTSLTFVPCAVSGWGRRPG